MSDFHNVTLDAHEAREAKAQAPIVIDATYWVTTCEWEQFCYDTAELGEMTAAAVKEGLAFKITSCPF